MTITAIAFLVLGVVLLVLGAEFLVRGASRLSAMFSVSPLVIGLTIVAFGTSAPELAVSLHSTLADKADIAIGNVVGSNICNVLLILGASALVSPLIVAQQLIRLDVPIMIGVSWLVLLFGWDQTINPTDGIVLFVGGVVYTLFLLYQSRKESDQNVQDEYAQEYGPQPFSWKKVGVYALLILVGLVALVIGSQLLVDSAETIATALGASRLVVGLTVVAIGTSLPELATSLVASFRGERDIAVGNVVGSNIFNILVVLGLTSALSPVGVEISAAALTFDIPVMVAVAVLCFPIFFSGNLISRWEGGLLLGYYLVYILYLILKTADHDSSETFGAILGFAVLPLTVLGLLVMTWRSRSARRHKSQN
ncbi:MAG: calcium/sodium antiporter [Cyanobacteria bacterium J06626_23]